MVWEVGRPADSRPSQKQLLSAQTPLLLSIPEAQRPSRDTHNKQLPRPCPRGDPSSPWLSTPSESVKHLSSGGPSPTARAPADFSHLFFPPVTSQDVTMDEQRGACATVRTASPPLAPSPLIYAAVSPLLLILGPYPLPSLFLAVSQEGRQPC